MGAQVPLDGLQVGFGFEGRADRLDGEVQKFCRVLRRFSFPKD
jgi:hypothetical protein